MTQVFISYSRKDLAFVERLAKDLQAAGLQVWYDLSGLEGGTRWGREIQNAIKESEIFVVVLSPNSIDSEWVEKEFMYANSLKKKIIPLLFQPCETPMWFINLHFIDVQGTNYENHLWIILKVMGVNPEDAAKDIKPAEELASIQAVPEDQIQPAPPVAPEADKPIPPSRGIKPSPAWIIGLVGLAALIVFGFWGLPALAARRSPTPTPIATATQIPSATPTRTATRTPTFTPTLTLAPSPTFTVFPTLDLATGVVSGSIGWNNRPFAGVLVKVCTRWLYTCSGTEFTGVTGADGKFTISGISPGDYQVITKYPGQNDETRLLDPAKHGLPMVLTVPAGQMTFLNPVSICKTDLVLFAPIIKGNSVTFSWQAYPGASSYGFQIINTYFGAGPIYSTSYTTTLPSGNYQWNIRSDGSCSQGFGNFTMP
jgi:hypothetical protein